MFLSTSFFGVGFAESFDGKDILFGHKPSRVFCYVLWGYSLRSGESLYYSQYIFCGRNQTPYPLSVCTFIVEQLKGSVATNACCR